jgi:hypothetical protein
VTLEEVVAQLSRDAVSLKHELEKARTVTGGPRCAFEPPASSVGASRSSLAENQLQAQVLHAGASINSMRLLPSASHLAALVLPVAATALALTFGARLNRFEPQVEALAAENRRMVELRAVAVAERAAALADQAGVVTELDAAVEREQAAQHTATAARFEEAQAKDEVQTLTVYIKGQLQLQDASQRFERKEAVSLTVEGLRSRRTALEDSEVCPTTLSTKDIGGTVT